MKYYPILFLLLTWLGSITPIWAQLNDPNDLKGYYPFNGNPNDESGNDQNGVVFGGMALGNDRNGFINSAYLFDGTDDYIALNTIGGLGQRLTIAAWVNITSNATATNTLFSFGSTGAGDEISIKIQGGKVVVDQSLGSTDETGLVIGYNTWVHLAVTVDNSSRDVVVYVNGTEVEEISNIISNNGAMGNAFIGVDRALDHDFFQGSMEDVRIYDRDLPSNLMDNLYELDSASNNGGQQISVWTTESGGVFYEQGKVRIGDVSTPDGYKLYVEQGLLAERVKISLKSTGDWADYVFAPDYTLRSLPEVEAYIRTHQHLPGIPSAESLVETGIDLGTINAKLLEKIEELTLYVIQQNQELTRLKERQSQLEQAIKP